MITRRFVGRQSAVISKERIQRPVLSNVAYTIQSKSVTEAKKITIFAAIFHKSPYGYHLLSLDSSYTPIQAWSNIKQINPIRSIAVRDISEFKKVLNQPAFKTLQEIHLNDAVPLVPLPENVSVFAYSNLSILVVLDNLKNSHNTKNDKNAFDHKTNTSIQPSVAKCTESTAASNRTKKGRNKTKPNNSTCVNNTNINKETKEGNDSTATPILTSHSQKDNGIRKGKRSESNNSTGANVNNCKPDTILASKDSYKSNNGVNRSVGKNATDKSNIDDNITSNPNSKTSSKKRNKKLERAISRCVSYDTLLLFHPEMTISEYHKFCLASN